MSRGPHHTVTVWGSVTNNNGFWIRWLDLLALLLQLKSLWAAHNQWLLKTRSVPYWTTSVFSSTVTDLVLIYELVTSSASVVHWLTLYRWTLDFSRMTYDWIIELSWTELNSRMTVPLWLTPSESETESYVTTEGRSVCLGIKNPSGAYDQILITVRQLRVCWRGALSLTRGRICRLQLLLALASAVIFRSESHGTRDHILLSQIRDFPFRRLQRLAGIQWRNSTPPPHGIHSFRVRVRIRVRVTLRLAIYRHSGCLGWSSIDDLVTLEMFSAKCNNLLLLIPSLLSNRSSIVDLVTLEMFCAKCTNLWFTRSEFEFVE
jgi:hypothetical protein